jgi:hypothetical protein
MKTSRLFLLFGMVTLAVPGVAQTSQPDSQTLKDILSEVRAIHNDVRLNETTQILLTEWQLQQTTVNAALQHRDSLRTELAQIQSNEKSTSAQAARFEDESSSPTVDPARKKQLADIEQQLKVGLAAQKVREDSVTNNLQEAELRLRNEQSTLDGIQAQLNDVVKKLQPATNP